MGTFLQFAVPVIFLAGADASLIRELRGTALLDGAATHGSAGINAMSWSEFEQLIEEAFRRQGYSVASNAGRGPDGGIDAVLRNAQGEFLVQCKHWRSRQVGVTVVRELLGVVTARRAVGGIVVTSGTFTAEAQEFAGRVNVELIDGQRLAAMIQSVRSNSPDYQGQEEQRSIAMTKPAAVQQAPPPNCPRCNGSMMMRTAKRGASAGGRFWGCKRFPKCRGTLPA
jgi:restriction system protein